MCVSKGNVNKENKAAEIEKAKGGRWVTDRSRDNFGGKKSGKLTKLIVFKRRMSC